MPLPTALLIANYIHPSIADEIQKVVPKGTGIELLSCKCGNHETAPHLMPHTPECSKMKKEVTANATPKTHKRVRSVSFFSDLKIIEDITSLGVEPKNEEELMKSLSFALDSLENIHVRFTNSHVNKKRKTKADNVIYGGRDLLDLGSNLTGPWEMRHPAQASTQDVELYRLPNDYSCSMCDFGT